MVSLRDDTARKKGSATSRLEAARVVQLYCKLYTLWPNTQLRDTLESIEEEEGYDRATIKGLQDNKTE